MKIDIEGLKFSIDAKDDEYEYCMDFRDVIHVALENAKKQLISDIAQQAKRDFLADERTKKVMALWKENMIKNLREQEVYDVTL